MEQAWFNELHEFIAIPSVSADPAHQDDVRRAAEWVRDFVKRIGGEAELVPMGERDLVIGDIPANTNTLLLSTGYTLAATTEVVGSNGSGTIAQSGGANNAGGLFLGQFNGDRGFYNLNGGTLSTVTNTTIGFAGDGTFTHTAGTRRDRPYKSDQAGHLEPRQLLACEPPELL